MATTTHPGASYINVILRGEIAAVETYDSVIEKFAGKMESSELIKIRDEHKAHVAALTDHVRKVGGEPDTSSGAWGTFTTALTAGAKLLGPETALSTLKQGEQHGIEQYEKALEEKDLPADTATAIRTKLLPEARAHLPVLEKLMETAGK